MNLWNLSYWQSGEYQVIEEHLSDLKKQKVLVNPTKPFKALKETTYEQCKVAIFGQDPYPNPAHATGIAFDLPADLHASDYPPTFRNLITEYKNDLHYPEPTTGSLLPWCRQGVLLWNSVPTCTAYSSLSHAHWVEYVQLNQEILKVLSDKEDVVFVFLGGIAKQNLQYVKEGKKILSYSHPSPRGSLNSKTPFLGSRMFTNINALLKEPIDWKLP